eukprot:PhM_4_TR2107/c0_g1_i2/m.67101
MGARAPVDEPPVVLVAEKRFEYTADGCLLGTVPSHELPVPPRLRVLGAARGVLLHVADIKVCERAVERWVEVGAVGDRAGLLGVVQPHQLRVVRQCADALFDAADPLQVIWVEEVQDNACVLVGAGRERVFNVHGVRYVDAVQRQVALEGHVRGRGQAPGVAGAAGDDVVRARLLPLALRIRQQFFVFERLVVGELKPRHAAVDVDGHHQHKESEDERKRREHNGGKGRVLHELVREPVRGVLLAEDLHAAVHTAGATRGAAAGARGTDWNNNILAASVPTVHHLFFDILLFICFLFGSFLSLFLNKVQK